MCIYIYMLQAYRSLSKLRKDHKVGGFSTKQIYQLHLRISKV
jgi:hypothetical protein